MEAALFRYWGHSQLTPRALEGPFAGMPFSTVSVRGHEQRGTADLLLTARLRPTIHLREQE
jgi:hypothetical protein